MPDERQRPALLSLREAAELLNLSDSQIRRLIRAGDLPTVPISSSDDVGRYNRIRIAAADIDTFINDRRTFRVAADVAS